MDYLKKNGWRATARIKEADLVIALTCGALPETESVSLQGIEALQKQKRPEAKMIVGGCLPDINPERIRESFRGEVFSARDTGPLERLAGGRYPLGEARYHGTEGLPDEKEVIPDEFLRTFEFMEALDRHFQTSRFRNIFRYSTDFQTRSWERKYEVKVAQGCAWNCSFCAARRARGPIRSRPQAEVLQEVRKGLELGYRRIMLIGDEVGDYGMDRGECLAELLEPMFELDPAFEVAFYYLAPFHLIHHYDRLGPLLESGRVYFFISAIQSGSPRILRRMRRPTDVERWLELVNGLSRQSPGLFLGTHIISGFPGETDFDFEQSLNLVEALDMDMIMPLMFAPRPHTDAAQMAGQVPEELRNRRHASLRRLVARKRLLKLFQRISRELKQLNCQYDRELMRTLGAIATYEQSSPTDEAAIFDELLSSWQAYRGAATRENRG